MVADGRYIAEERCGWWIFARWEGIDRRNPQFLWSPGDQFYCDCLGSYQEVLKGVAGRGY